MINYHYIEGQTPLDEDKNPRKLWDVGGLEHKRTVLKLAFNGRVSYCLNNGLQTPQTARIFGLFSDFLTNDSGMVEPRRVELLTS